MFEKIETEYGNFRQMLLASVLTLIVALLIGKVFVPVITLFRRSLSMSKMASSPRGHWFYGHLKQVRD